MLSARLSHASPAPHNQASTCKRELEHANRTMTKWADTMEQMVNESNLSGSIRDSIHSEANKILDMIEEFNARVGKPEAVASSLASDLVTIRRRSNRMALDIYLNTFDMRWPQNSLQLGVIVERVQQACLDRATIQALETPPNPLEELPKLVQMAQAQ